MADETSAAGNPYAAPAAELETAPEPEQELLGPAKYRKDHLPAERHIKALGGIYYFVATIHLVTIVLCALLWHGDKRSTSDFLFDLVRFGLPFACAGGSAFLLRRLRPAGVALSEASSVATVAGLGVSRLLWRSGGVEIALPIGFYVVMLLPIVINRLSIVKGEYAEAVFSEAYQKHVIPKTPQMTSRTAWWLWVALPALIALVVMTPEI